MSGNHLGRWHLPGRGRRPHAGAAGRFVDTGKTRQVLVASMQVRCLHNASTFPDLLNDDVFTRQRMSAGMALPPVRRLVGVSNGILDLFSLYRNGLASNFPFQERKLVSPPACRHETRISAALRRGTEPAFSRICKTGKAGARHGLNS